MNKTFPAKMTRLSACRKLDIMLSLIYVYPFFFVCLATIKVLTQVDYHIKVPLWF